jgi:hypothetical protein
MAGASEPTCGLKTESGERADVVTGQQLRNIGINGRNITINGLLQDIQPNGGGALSPSTVGGTDRGGDWPVVYSYSIGYNVNCGSKPLWMFRL